jgi:ABC-type multidrug transport system ATPase subunit/ABC-type multidrug transport system permease subunit
MADEDLISPELVKDITQVEISWEDIFFNVRTKAGTLEVLKGISGSANPGEFLVIMGSSGAGKTTFLNVLSDRVQKTKNVNYSGDVKVNGSLISQVNFKSYIGYVTQEDILIECLTVKESLMFSARLKINESFERISRKVNSLIKELLLENCQNTYIGGVMMKGVSGGERKRTCIGIELITEPSVLFLDEPTSGLDSFTASIVINLLVTQAKKGRTIISTIHQPSSQAFFMFDKLLLMSDGWIVYHGPAADCIDFFSQSGFECPPLSNPADFFIEVLNIKRPHELDHEEQERLQKLLLNYKDQQQRIKKHSILGNFQLENQKTGRKTNFFFQVFMNFNRFGLRVVRNPGLGVIKIFIMTFNAAIINIFYYQISHKGASGYRNTNGVIFFHTMSLFFSNVQNNVLSFPLIRSLVIKEYNSNMYSVSSILVAKTLIDIIVDAILVIYYGNLIYWGVGLTDKDLSYVLYFFYMSFFVHMAGGALGMICGAIFKSNEVAMMFSSLAILPSLYFSGFYRSENIPKEFKWLENLSVVKYGYQGLVKNQWDGVGNPEICLDKNNRCRRALDILDITMDVHESLGYLVLIMIVIRIITGIILEIVVRKNRS